MMNKLLVSVSIALVLGAGAVQAAGDAEAGKAKAAVCLACHGPEGNSVNPQWPRLAGQYSSYIAKQLHDFKAGTRKDPLMSAQATPLTDDDINNLAAYFSSTKGLIGEAAADQVEMGESIYRAGNADSGVAACVACHGPAGAGNEPANFPSLSGQHATYVEKALKDFRAGTRSNDANSMMQGVTASMTDAEIAAVAQYIQGLHD